MSARKDTFMWLWVGIAIVAIITTTTVFMMDAMRPKTTLYLGDGIFTARLARTEAERSKGLSGVADLPRDKAMLFVFTNDGTHQVWMKDMKIPIDIVWLDAAKKVIHVAHKVSPETYPATFRSQRPARYVIELAAGVASERAIRVGVTARFDDVHAKEVQ